MKVGLKLPLSNLEPKSPVKEEESNSYLYCLKRTASPVKQSSKRIAARMPNIGENSVRAKANDVMRKAFMTKQDSYNN